MKIFSDLSDLTTGRQKFLNFNRANQKAHFFYLYGK